MWQPRKQSLSLFFTHGSSVFYNVHRSLYSEVSEVHGADEIS